MIVLGLDTSTRSTAVGLLLADGRLLQARDDPTGEQRPGHATRLLPLVHSLLAGAGIAWSDIERIAVGVGPGTFTGLRIGVATARGLAQSLGIDIVGVSSLRALAHAAVRGSAREATARCGPGAKGASDMGERGANGRVREPGEHGANGATSEPGERASVGVLAVIDARRNEVFAAAYHDDRELIAPAPLPPAELRALRERADAQAGSRTWTAVGDGAVRYRHELERAGALVPGDRSTLHRVDGRAICELGFAGHPDDSVVPDYRRRPDAEIACPTPTGCAHRGTLQGAST